MTRALFFTAVAFLAGLALQCASDPAITGPDSAIQRLLSDIGISDGAGSHAEAGNETPTGVGRRVFKGVLDEDGNFKLCEGWSIEDPPLLTVWTGTAASAISFGGTYARSDTPQLDVQGCLSFGDPSWHSAGQDYRVVVVQ